MAMLRYPQTGRYQIMELSDQLRCLFTAEVERRDGSYFVKIPESEIDLGTIENGSTYRVAMLSALEEAEPARERSAPQGRQRGGSAPPVSVGETVEVEIEDIGEQGDGIARIGPGYIVFVPDTDVGDRVTIEINDARENFAFGEVVDGPY